MPSYKQLDTAQQTAVDHVNGPFLCIAGPGSGKTTVIVNRVRNLVRAGVIPESILTVTFSKASAMEMDNRYRQLEGAVAGPTFCTIHSFAFMVLRYVYGYTANNIMDESKKNRYIAEQIRNTETKVKRLIDKKKMTANVSADISAFKCLELSPDFKPSAFRNHEDFRKFYNEYESYKYKNTFIDYDDMLYFCRDVFRSRPDILKIYQDYFRYIMIDEFQDTSAVQAEIMYNVAKPLNNIFVCGDDDQSIYKFRGARPDIMLQFPNDYPNCGISKLVTNYRSDSSIIQGAGKLIRHNTVRFEKDISGNSKKSGEIRNIMISEEDNAHDILISLIKEESVKAPLHEIAILCRTNKEVSEIARILSNENIPFYCNIPVENFHDSFIYKALIDYLYIIQGDNSWKRIKSIINKPSRYISKNDISQANCLGDLCASSKWNVRRNAVELRKDIFELRRFCEHTNNISETARFIMQIMNLKEYISATCDYLFLDLEEHLDAAEKILKEMEGFKTVEEYERFVEKSNQMFTENIKKSMEDPVDKVVVSTLHKAKGLEYDSVLIPSCNYGNIPYCKDDELDDESMEEERRLFYVGITRARKRCQILCNTNKEISDYVREVFEEEDR